MCALENVNVAVWTHRSEDQQAIELAFTHLGCSVDQVATEEELLRLARDKRLDLVAAALSADFLEPLELLSRGEETSSLPPIVVLADAWGTDLYMEALELGAFDGVSFPIDERELLRVVAAALQRTVPLAA